MREATLGGRLLTVAKFVRWGATFADIGTDHAHLPVFLLSQGKIDRAVCSDINEGPLNNAIQNTGEFGLMDKISFHLTDGAATLSGLGITDMAICGMGGELIAKIIDEAPYVKSDRVRLILQPMTKQEHLRRYLYENGFELVGEDYATEAGKSYLVLACTYSGHKLPQLTSLQVEFGNIIAEDTVSQAEYFKTKLNSMLRARAGRADGGSDTSEDELRIEYLGKRIAELDKKNKENQHDGKGTL